MAIGLMQLAFEMPVGLLLGAVKDHGRWDSILMEHQGKSVMGLAFLGHGVRPRPSKGCGIHLFIFIPTLGARSSDEGVSKDRMWQPIILEHPVIGQESVRERRVYTHLHTVLSCPKDSPFSTLWGYQPSCGKDQQVNWLGFTQDLVTIQCRVHT